ncbi:MAG TPA: MipA/OmpV family protein [Caldimonas sp.]|nr:MipA/OmpV family protein [Caldimonas sp.]
MTRPTGRRALALPLLVSLGACGLGAGAWAEDMPLPGPVVGGPVVQAPAEEAVRSTEPLWELGIGLAGFRFDDYRGSDHTNYYLLPIPFFAYRGPFLRADRDGARAILFSGQRVVVDVSLGASVPTKSKDDEARSGMPNLAGTFEIGPNFIVELWEASNRKMKVELRLPVREAITLERSPRAIGLTFSPNLNLDISGLPGKGNLGLLAGPLFADQRYHQYFYGVAPEFATANRPAYQAPGGYAGWRATTAFSRRFGNAWLGAFVRYDNLHGALFAPSPLVRKETTVTAGFGISWIFATSSQRVLTDD